MKYVPSALCLLLVSCSTNYPPERSPIVPQAPPPIVITVRGGDFSQRTEMPILERYLERRREEPLPEFEETLYSRKPIYRPDPLQYKSYQEDTIDLTPPDRIQHQPLEAPRYPYYYNPDK